MTKLAPEWVRTSDPVIRSPARYHWTTAPASQSAGAEPPAEHILPRFDHRRQLDPLVQVNIWRINMLVLLLDSLPQLRDSGSPIPRMTVMSSPWIKLVVVDVAHQDSRPALHEEEGAPINVIDVIPSVGDESIGPDNIPGYNEVQELAFYLVELRTHKAV